MLFRSIDENVEMIERADQLGVFRQHHAVAEDVAGHVTDADTDEVFGLDVLAGLAKVTLDGFPGAAGGDAHLLVVVADAAARREGIAQPESVIERDAIGDIGKGRGASVREVINLVLSATNKNGSKVIESPRRAGDPAFLCADVELAKSSMGFTSRYSLQESIASLF